MLDPITIRQLAQIQCQERMQAAARARQARAQRAGRRRWHGRALLMLARHLVLWGQRLQVSPQPD